jgi:hypothetical protein
MKKSLLAIVAVLAAIAILADWGQEYTVVVENNELYVEAGDFKGYFELGKPFSETYIVFGIQQMDPKYIFNNFWLSGIPIEDARPLYTVYPDFYKCKSPGAARATKLTRDMNIISADSSVTDALNEAISAFHNSHRGDGDRVAVVLEGVKLKMTAAIDRDRDDNMLNRLPKDYRENYFLVESVKIIDEMIALEKS